MALTNYGTHTWFTDEILSKQIQVSAATTQDILSKYRIKYEDAGNNQNPLEIILQKNPSITRDITIFFAVEGEARKYLPHLNPIVLTSLDEKSIEIKPSINLIQFIRLVFGLEGDVIPGTITFKYLNYINEEYEINFTRDYLIQKFIESVTASEQQNIAINEENSLYHSRASEERRQQISHIIEYLAHTIPWEEASWSRRAEIQLLSDLEEFTVKTEMITIDITELELTEDQTRLIDIIAPKLLNYLQDLYSYTQSLIADLNEKIIMIGELRVKIEQLEEYNMNILLEQEKLQNEYKELMTEYEQLQNEVNHLNQQYRAVSAENSYLWEQIRALEAERVANRGGGTPSTSPTAPGDGEEQVAPPAEPVTGEEPVAPPTDPVEGEEPAVPSDDPGDGEEQVAPPADPGDGEKQATSPASSVENEGREPNTVPIKAEETSKTPFAPVEGVQIASTDG